MPKQKVLIVEDKFLLYEELCDYFEEKGYAVVKNVDEVAVDNYEEAVQLAAIYRPDIAVLDIELKSENDGIDLAKFLKQCYNMPIVYLSGYDTPGNLERISKAGDEQFVVKSGKPLDKKQLWATFYLASKKITAEAKPAFGNFIKVKRAEIQLNGDPEKVVVKDLGETLDAEIRIWWDEFVVILACNKKVLPGHNNHVLLCKNFSNNVYVYRISLDTLEEQLPYYFARFSQHTIVNLKEATERIREQKKLYYKIAGKRFEVSDNYKDIVQAKVERLLSDTGFHIPEK